MKRLAVPLFLALSAYLGGMSAVWLSRNPPAAFAQGVDATRAAPSDPSRLG